MAVEKIYSGDDSDTTFDITFPFLASTDVQASVNDVTKTAGTDYTISGTVLTFTTAPPTGTNNVKIFRVTDISSPQATFTAGSSVKATDLNNVVKQMLYAIEEVGTVTASNTGLGLVAGSKGDIHVNSATDWYIKTGVVENSMLANFTLSGSKLAGDCIDASKIANDVLNSEHYAAGSIDNEHLSANCVAANNIQDASITASKLTTAAQNTLLNPIGTVIWYAGSSAPTGYLKCNGDSVPNGSGTVQSITHDFSLLYDVVGGSLPDLRGEFIRGWDDGRNIDSGRAIRTTQSDSIKEHNHGISLTANTNSASLTGTATTIAESWNDDGNASGIFSKSTGYNSSHTPGGPDNNNCGSLSIDATHTHSVTLSGNTANTGVTETKPRNVSLLACIKY